MTRDDAVSPILAAEVFERDRKIVATQIHSGSATVWRNDRLYLASLDQVVCPAVIIDPKQIGKCWGRWRIEHVKKQPRGGKRAEPLLSRLMALCQGHTEDGMKAGHVWATAHREEQRDYLERANAATS